VIGSDFTGSPELADAADPRGGYPLVVPAPPPGQRQQRLAPRKEMVCTPRCVDTRLRAQRRFSPS